MKNQKVSPSFIILSFLICIIWITGVIEYCGFDLYGRKFLNDKENLCQIRCLLKTGTLGEAIIYNQDKPYIGRNYLSFFNKYHLDHYGLIPRWTQMSKEIDQWVEEKQRIKDSIDKANLQKEIDNICN